MRRRLSSGPGFTTDFIDDGGGSFTLHTRSDVGALLDLNARSYDDDRMARRKMDTRHVASISNVVLTKWMREEGITPQEAAHPEVMDRLLKKKLNDSENAKFRVGPERL